MLQTGIVTDFRSQTRCAVVKKKTRCWSLAITPRGSRLSSTNCWGKRRVSRVRGKSDGTMMTWWPLSKLGQASIRLYSSSIGQKHKLKHLDNFPWYIFLGRAQVSLYPDYSFIGRCPLLDRGYPPMFQDHWAIVVPTCPVSSSQSGIIGGMYSAKYTMGLWRQIQ